MDNQNKADMKSDESPFRLTSSMRMGTISYEESGQMLEIEWEMGNSSSPSDILILGGFSYWKTPSNTALPVPKQLEILDQLRIWLTQNNIKSNIDLPQNINQSDKECSWAGCSNPQLGDKSICLYHFNLSCIGIYSQHNPRST